MCRKTNAAIVHEIFSCDDLKLYVENYKFRIKLTSDTYFSISIVIVGKKLMYKSILIFFILISFDVFSQKGKPFPLITGETLDDKTITIPTDTKGKYTLIGMAYSQRSEDELKTWFLPVYQTFIYKSNKPVLFANDYDVNVYFIPMFTGVKQAAAATVKKKMKGSTDESLIPHILLYKGELKKYKDELDFEKKDKPYFYVLDETGKIVYATSGSYTDDKMADIESFLEEE